MSGGHFFDIFWTFFQRQPQHQDTFHTLFGHFCWEAARRPQKAFWNIFWTFFGKFSFYPFYEFPLFLFSFLLFIFFFSLVFVPDIFPAQPQHQDTFQTLFGHFSGRLPGSPKRHFGTLFGHFSAISRFGRFYDLRTLQV